MKKKSYSTYYHVGEQFAGLSGAALGFILGDVKGAVTGYTASKELYRRVRPIKYVRVGSGPAKWPSRGPASVRKRVIGSAPRVVTDPKTEGKPVSVIRVPRWGIPYH